MIRESFQEARVIRNKLLRGTITAATASLFFSAIVSCAKKKPSAGDWPGGLDDRRAVQVIPPALAAEVEAGNLHRDVIGLDNWSRMLAVSKDVRENGLTAVSEARYLPLAAQREVFHGVATAESIAPDLKLALQDILIQYYFFTYYYDRGGPRETEFGAADKEFLDGLGVEYVWVEPAAQNYYQHTFLKKLVADLPDSQWGRLYAEIYRRTGFRDVPAADVEREGPPGGREEAVFSGRLLAGQGYEAEFGPGLVFKLVPRPYGWEVEIGEKGRDVNLARLTPPLHFAPNPRELEGWHFRNADNTGPNEPGEKNVNAPGDIREFIFSPEVGRTIQGADANRAPDETDIEKVRTYGRGILKITDYALADLEPGRKARFASLAFEVRFSFPRR